MSVNKVFLKGRLGQDPENNNGVVKFSIATSERYTDKQGEKQEVTQWHNCVAFNKTGEILEKYLKKGQEVFIEGKINYNKHEEKIYTSIVVLSFDFISSGNTQTTETPKQQNSISSEEPDDLPFNTEL
jgi:single-strand DNA-binding protein